MGGNVMKGAERKRRMGSYVTAIGLFLKVVQIVCTAAGAEAFGNTVWTALTACFLAGGLLIFALERRGATGVFASLGALCALCSVINTQSAYLLYVPLFGLPAVFSLMLLTMRGKSPLFGFLSLVCVVILALCALKVMVISAAVGTYVLVIMYIFLCVGLLL